MECGICFTESSKWDEMCVEHHRVCVKCSLCMRLAQRQVVNNELVVSCPFCRRAPKSGLRRHAHSLFAENFILREIPEITFLQSCFLIAKITRTAFVLYIVAAYTVYFLSALHA